LISGNSKSNSFKKILLLELMVFELFVLIVMEVYKYYINYDSQSFFSKEFLNYFISNFEIIYIGNLLWPALFLISLFSLINLFRNISIAKESSLKVLIILSFILLLVLGVAVFIPSSDFIDEFSGKVIQLNTKGTKTVFLAVFAALKLFMSVSISVIAFVSLSLFAPCNFLYKRSRCVSDVNTG